MLLPKNPVTMVGRIDRCWLFTYATPAAEARRLLPPQLEPVTHRDSAFWNVVVSHIRAMRPKGLPATLGVSYWHVAYRLSVRLRPLNRPAVEGLYFVRSDCDSPIMALAGNLVTDFNFHTAGVRVDECQDGVEIEIDSPDAPASARLSSVAPAGLPPGSAFDSLDEAARCLKYKPFGISIDSTGRANLVRIVRREEAWRSRLVRVESAEWAFLAGRPVRPEICYDVAPIDYQWNRGRILSPDALACASS